MTVEGKSSIGTLTIKGTTYEIPTADDLTLGECEEIKNVSGYGVEDFYQATFRIEGPALLAFAAILLRRAGKRFSMDQLRETKLSDLKFEAAPDVEEEDEDPTRPALADDAKPRLDGSPTSSNGSPGSEAPPVAAGAPSSGTTSG